jgi:abortive infection bacteriophage resistance protein
MQAKTRKEIAFEYGINVKTLSRWLKNNGVILDRGLITPKKQLEIYNKLGCPISTK